MEAVKLMRGPVGSKINLTIRRKGVRDSINKIIKREIIEVRSVETKIIKKNIQMKIMNYIKVFGQQIYILLVKTY